MQNTTQGSTVSSGNVQTQRLLAARLRPALTEIHLVPRPRGAFSNLAAVPLDARAIAPTEVGVQSLTSAVQIWLRFSRSLPVLCCSTIVPLLRIMCASVQFVALPLDLTMLAHLPVRLALHAYVWRCVDGLTLWTVNVAWMQLHLGADQCQGRRPQLPGRAQRAGPVPRRPGRPRWRLRWHHRRCRLCCCQSAQVHALRQPRTHMMQEQLQMSLDSWQMVARSC